MNVDLERAIVRYYTTRFAADTTLTGKTYTILAAMGDDPIPEKTPVITVKVTETPSKMATLVDAQVDTLVAVPMDIDADATATVALYENAVRRAWDEITHPTATEDLNTLVEDECADYIGGGFDAQGWQKDQDGNMALPTYRVHVGLVRG